MSITQTSDDQIPYKFAITLYFVNGLCPICKRQIYELKGLNMTLDVEKGKQHFLDHSKEEQRAYRKNIENLGL